MVACKSSKVAGDESLGLLSARLASGSAGFARTLHVTSWHIVAHRGTDTQVPHGKKLHIKSTTIPGVFLQSWPSLCAHGERVQASPGRWIPVSVCTSGGR